MKHIVFYDGECPLCNRSVRFILGADRKQLFYFAPLKGKTAEAKLAHIRLKDPKLDTMVLLQDYQTADEQILIEGRAALRVLWLLSGKYALLGWLSFLPSLLFDAIYRLVARYRYQLFRKKVTTPVFPDRFLP